MNHPQPHDLTALAYGLVEADERNRLLEHVHLCDDCRALYDSYLEEQALVRDSLYRDARSGPAEARALERTLQVLSGEPEPAPARVRGIGRIFQLVTWQFVGKAAAVIVVALGLLVTLTPRPDPTEPVMIAQDRQVAARVLSGRPMVPTGNQWRPASAIPSQEWIAAAGDEPLQLEFETGAKFEAEPGTVFRFIEATTWEVPAVCVLHGQGWVSAAPRGYGLTMALPEGDYVPLAGSKVSYYARINESPQWRPEAAAMRAYLMPRTIKLRQLADTGLYLPAAMGVMPGVVSDGQELVCSTQGQEVPGQGSILVRLALESDVRNQLLASTEVRAKALHELVQRRSLDAKLQEQLTFRIAQIGASDWSAAFSSGPHGTAPEGQERRRYAEVQKQLERNQCAVFGNDNLQVIIERLEGDGSLTATVIREEEQFLAPSRYEAPNLPALVDRLPGDVASLLQPPAAARHQSGSGAGTARGGPLVPDAPAQPGPRRGSR